MTIPQLSFGAPWLLALLLLPLLAVPVAWPRLRRTGWRRAALASTLRIVALVCVVFALADLRALTPGGPKATVFVIDSSASTADLQSVASAWVRRALSGMGPEDLAAVIAAAREPLVLQPLGAAREFVVPQTPADDRTDLASALALARAILPESGVRRVVLLTDGWSNRGASVQAAADSLAADGIVVDVAPVGGRQKPLAVRALETPGLVREGETVEVVLPYESLEADTATLTIRLDAGQPVQQTVQLRQGAGRLSVPLRVDSQGFQRVSATIAVGAATQASYGWVNAKPKSSALIFEDRPGEGALLENLLAREGVAVERRLSRTIPTSTAPLLAFDTILMSNVSATTLRLDQQLAIQSYVRVSGKGVVFIGGSSSYTLGDYGSSAFAPMLPVNPNAPPKPEEGAFGLALIIDKSGSMEERSEGVTKIQMAKEAALQAIDLLKDDDYITVVVFDSANRFLVAPQRVSDNRGVPAIAARVAGLGADGGTEIYPALERGFNGIRETPARFKHMLLISDGQSFGGDYDRLLRELRLTRVTLSALAIGRDADQTLMSRLANEGGGRYFFTEHLRDIPKIVQKETTIALSPTTAKGETRPQFVQPSPLLRGITPASIPPVQEFAVTLPREEAETILISPNGDPLLAHWQYGSGRVAAFTGSLQEDWAGAWLAWPQLPQLLAQAARWAAGQAEDPGIALDVRSRADEVSIVADTSAVDGGLLDLATLQGTLVGPSGRSVSFPLRQTAPGRYEARGTVAEPGAYEVRVRASKTGVPDRAEVAGFVALLDPEERTLAPNEGLLRLISGATGGRIITSPADAFADTARTPGLLAQPLFPWLIGAALALFVLDIAARRLRISFRGKRTL